MKIFNAITPCALALSGWGVTHPQVGPRGPEGAPGLSIVGPLVAPADTAVVLANTLNSLSHLLP